MPPSNLGTGEPTDGQKEVTELQKRILSLEESISLMKGKGDDSKTAQAKIAELESKLVAVQKEKDELQQKISLSDRDKWDKKERRAKERRIVVPGKRDIEPMRNGDDWEIMGGHF